MEKMTTIQAIVSALDEEMERDETVVHLGIDVAKAGGVFKTSSGLLAKYGPRRVIDTPISEGAVVSMATGAAMVGLRPVVQLMFADFVPRAFDEVVNQAAKIRYMFGNINVPLTIMASSGGGLSAAAQHSQSLEAVFAQIPGLKVVCPSTPGDCKGLLKSAIRDDNPVIFFDSKALMGTKGPVGGSDSLIAIGEAAVVREGTDLTIVSLSRMVYVALDAAAALAGEGIEAEVVDLRSVYPMDVETIVRSVAKTRRLVVIHEAPTFAGIGAEVVAGVLCSLDESLLCPPVRLGSPHTPIPFAKELEESHFPSKATLMAAVQGMLARSGGRRAH